VHDERERLPVQAIDQRVELLDLGRRVWRIAKQAEGEWPARQRRERRAAGQQRGEEEKPRCRTPS
jgi:hypothetical protein